QAARACHGDAQPGPQIEVLARAGVRIGIAVPRPDSFESARVDAAQDRGRAPIQSPRAKVRPAALDPIAHEHGASRPASDIRRSKLSGEGTISAAAASGWAVWLPQAEAAGRRFRERGRSRTRP